MSYTRTEKRSYKRHRIVSGLCKDCQSRPKIGFSYCQRCRNARARQRSRKVAELRQGIIAHYGRACQCCGEKKILFLQLDLVRNDGASHRRQINGNTYQLYRWIITNGYPDTFQILCANCNWAKGIYGYCPHKKASEFNIKIPKKEIWNEKPILATLPLFDGSAEFS